MDDAVIYEVLQGYTTLVVEARQEGLEQMAIDILMFRHLFNSAPLPHWTYTGQRGAMVGDVQEMILLIFKVIQCLEKQKGSTARKGPYLLQPARFYQVDRPQHPLPHQNYSILMTQIKMKGCAEETL